MSTRIPKEYFRPFLNESCEGCGKPFRSWHNNARYCSNTCSVRANPKPQNQKKYPITSELLEEVDNETADLESPQKELAFSLGCTVATVSYAAKRLGYSWRQRRNSRGEYGPTTEVEQRYAREIGCVVCGENRVTDAAHLIPRKRGGVRAVSNIVPLCPTHHRLYDRGKLSDEENNKLVVFLFIKYPNLRQELEESKQNGGTLDSEGNGEDGEEGDCG